MKVKQKCSENRKSSLKTRSILRDGEVVNWRGGSSIRSAKINVPHFYGESPESWKRLLRMSGVWSFISNALRQFFRKLSRNLEHSL